MSVEQKQDELLAIQRGREDLVSKVCLAIDDERISSRGDKLRIYGNEALALLCIAERIIQNCQRCQTSRHQYDDSRCTLSGCTMSLEDIDSALAVVRQIRGV